MKEFLERDGIMSRCFKQILECPNCHHKQDFLVWYSLNNEEYPEVNQALKDGDLFSFQCEQSHHRFFIDRHFVYHMVAEKMIVHLILDAKDEEMTYQQVRHLQNISSEHHQNIEDSYDKSDVIEQRIVRHFEDLLEKITVAETGLDDHVIELMKHMIIEKAVGYFPIKFEDFRFIVLNNEPAFIFIHQNKIVYRVPFSMPFYQQVYRGFKRLIEEDTALIIDDEWANQMYEYRERESDL